MRQRSTASSKVAKARSRRAKTLKALRHRRSLGSETETEVARLTRERDEALERLSEALEQQTATSDVLRFISGSPGDLQPVFEAMLANATRLCEAKFGVLFRSEGDALRAVALHNAPLAYAEERRRNPIIRPNPKTALGRAVASKQTVHTADMLKESNLKESNYFDAPSDHTAAQITKLGGARTVLAVPMIKDGELIGVLVIYRQEVRSFTEKQIALVENFAAQAVIAIENARLLNELRQRTEDLSKSLEQQTATSEVLKVISSAQGELQPVFDAILENATRICQASFGNLILYDGKIFYRVALYNAPAAWAEDSHKDPRRTRDQAPLLYRLADTKALVHVADILAEAPNDTLNKFTGARSLLIVPMLKGDELVGGVGIYRQEVSPFSEKQIALLKNFASQAVIAIENARLLNELRQSLQQQTATADVLKVISRSTFDLQAVLNTLVESAARLCEADIATMHRQEGTNYRAIANYGGPPVTEKQA